MKPTAESMCPRLLLVLLSSVWAVPSALSEVQPSNSAERTHCASPDVTVVYDSMRMNGRKIFGGIVPYGQIWQTGPKHSPTFVTSVDLMLGGKEVPAGHYSLLTVPNPSQWTLLVMKVTGKRHPNEMAEVAKVDLLSKRLPSPLEAFMVSFDQWKGGCVLNLRWEQTEASVLLAEKK